MSLTWTSGTDISKWKSNAIPDDRVYYLQPPAQTPVVAGWLCPRCGRGNAPFVQTCPCVPLPPPTVTC